MLLLRMFNWNKVAAGSRIMVPDLAVIIFDKRIEAFLSVTTILFQIIQSKSFLSSEFVTVRDMIKVLNIWPLRDKQYKNMVCVFRKDQTSTSDPPGADK